MSKPDTNLTTSNDARESDAGYFHDFGVLLPRTKANHIFAVHNPGPAEWILRSVSESCTCTAAEISTERIAPGETTEVKVGYSAKSALGNDEQAVSLYFEGRETPVVLRVKARIRNHVSLFPDELHAGTVGRGQDPQFQFQIQNFSGADWEKPVYRSDVQWLDVSATPVPLNNLDPMGPRQVWRGVVRLKTDQLRSGRHRGHVTVEARARNEVFSAILPVEFHIEPPVAAIPQQFFFGRVEAGKPISRSILIRFAGDRPVSSGAIDVTHTLSDRLKIMLIEKSGNDFSLHATLTPKTSDEYLSGIVTLRFHDSKDLPELSIPVRAVMSTNE